MTVTYEWRGRFADDELNALHAEAFGHEVLADRWVEQVERWSLGWVTAHDDDGLVAFVNVPWDGLVHAFIIDPIVAGRARRRGIGTALINMATEEARAAGCEWLHVDFEDELTSFYLETCGFRPTKAGLIDLRSRPAT